MCSPTRCRDCGKTTWTGCGEHVAAVRAGIPDDQWCSGHADKTPRGPSWLARFRTR